MYTVVYIKEHNVYVSIHKTMYTSVYIEMNINGFTLLSYIYILYLYYYIIIIIGIYIMIMIYLLDFYLTMLGLLILYYFVFISPGI